VHHLSWADHFAPCAHAIVRSTIGIACPGHSGRAFRQFLPENDVIARGLSADAGKIYAERPE
jgi:hypothetical protein